MNILKFTLAGAIGMGMLVACDDTDNTPAPAPATPQRTPSNPDTSDTQTLPDAIRDAGRQTGQAVQLATRPATRAVGEMADEVRADTGDFTARVRELRENPAVNQIITALEANRVDDAAAALQNAENHRQSLPQSIQQMLPKLRTIVERVRGDEEFQINMLQQLWQQPQQPSQPQ